MVVLGGCANFTDVKPGAESGGKVHTRPEVNRRLKRKEKEPIEKKMDRKDVKHGRGEASKGAALRSHRRRKQKLWRNLRAPAGNNR